ncbi:MAG: luciferase [Candidatus Sericytochromatia bacterium]
MIFDVFFSICQTNVDGYIPSEKQMLLNFFDQVKIADQLGYKTAWVAETHLSCQVQKENKNPVIPKFEGEIGLNTDILQLAHKIFSITKNINVGSAIRNILCNGGPLAHAEAIKTFLSLHGLDESEKRLLEIGFASGRFQFSNSPYGIVPRNKIEEIAWNVVKGKIFHEALEIFLRGLRGDIFSSSDISKKFISKKDFRNISDWEKIIEIIGNEVEDIEIAPYWNFEKVGVIPYEAPLKYLKLTIGSHDPSAQILANKFYPCGVFNLSITPANEIEETHERMKKNYNTIHNQWDRSLMPRTVLVFLNNDKNLTEVEQRAKAKEKAINALENYWKAIEGTLDPMKIEKAVDNALVGSVDDIRKQLESRFNKEDRLMLWFDFNNHNNKEVMQSMIDFKECL